jgi:phage gpG-like protein
MITGTVVGAEEVVQRFQSMPGALREQLKIGIGRAVLRVQAYSKADKLSGQVLQVRTGRLRRSINTRVEISADKVTGVVGTNVEYARVHEYGFSGTVTVREHLRRTVTGAQALVRPHARRMNLPERSFLRSALHDMEPQIREEFEQAVKRAIQA